MTCKAKWIAASTAALVGVLCLVEGAVYAASFDIDPNYGVQGSVTFSSGQQQAQFGSSILQPDGKLIVTGNRTTLIGGQPGAELFAQRFNVDGTPDAGFGKNGESRFSVRGNDAIKMITLQADGKLLLLGTNGISRMNILNWRLARFNADGTRDAGFNGGQTVLSRCQAFGYSLLVQPDGGIVVGGDDGAFYADSAVNPGFCIERLHPDGSHDPAFNQGSLWTNFRINVSSLASLTALPDGKLLAVGRGVRKTNTPAQTNYESGVISSRYAANGVLDAAYGDGGKWFVPIANSYRFVNFTFARDGGIVAAGYEDPSPPSGSPWQYRIASHCSS